MSEPTEGPEYDWDDPLARLRTDLPPLGLNTWGNLGLKVAHRYEPRRTGIVVADGGYGPWLIAEAENGRPTVEPAGCPRNWVGFHSPIHLEALAALRA